MKKKLIGIALAACMTGTMALSTFGSAVTVDEVLANNRAATEAAKAFTADVAGQADVEIAVADQTMAFKGDVTMNMQTNMDPLEAQAKGSLNLDAMGQAMNLATEMYMKNDESGVLKSYAGVDEGEGMQWTVSSTDTETIEAVKAFLLNQDFSDLPITFELADGTVDVNGAQCYKVTATLGVEDVLNLYNYALEKAGDAIPADQLPQGDSLTMMAAMLGGLKVNFEMDINAETYLMEKCRIDMDGSDFSMIGMLVGSMMGGASEEGEEAPAININVNSLFMEMVYSYGEPTEIVVPQEAIDNAVEQSLTDIAGEAAEMVPAA